MSTKRLLKLAENPVAEEDDDLESLLGGDDEDEEEELSDKEEIAEMRKSLGEQSRIMLSLTRSLSAIAKHVMALQSDDDEDEELEATTGTPDSEEDVMEKGESATESDFSPYGDADLGEPDAGTPETPAMSAASSESAETDPGLVSLQRKSRKSVVRKDDSSSNFGKKDSDIPGNPPVTPDTKDWPADQTVIPHSGLAPTLKKELAEIRAALVSAGIIKKAMSPTVGARTEEKAPDLQALEDRARGMTHQELNRWRISCGDLPAGIV